MPGIYNYLNGGLFAGFAGAGLVVLSHAYKELYDYIQSIATAQGKTDLAKAESKNTCLLGLVTEFAFKNFSAETTVDNVLDQPIPKKVGVLPKCEPKWARIDARLFSI